MAGDDLALGRRYRGERPFDPGVVLLDRREIALALRAEQVCAIRGRADQALDNRASVKHAIARILPGMRIEHLPATLAHPRGVTPALATTRTALPPAPRISRSIQASSPSPFVTTSLAAWIARRSEGRGS